MIAKKYIESTLKELDKLYNSPFSQKKTIYFSKLAIMELSGWIEETIDDIIIRHANRNLKEPKNKKYCKERIIRPNYGFQYDKNIRPMLINLLGLIDVEKLEKKLEKNFQLELFEENLKKIIEIRNRAAHTYLKGATRTFDSPSIIINSFNNIIPVLENIDKELRDKKYK